MRSASLALAALLAAACGGGSQVLKTTSAPRPPAWLGRAQNTPDTLYFTGGKEGAASLEEGKASAVEVARSQAAQYVGVEITAEHSDVMSTEEAANRVTDQVKSRAAAMIRAAEVADVYYEKISREAGATTIDRFDVWVLLRISRAEIAKERDRQQQEARQAATAALARFREGKAAEASGDVFAALVRYRDAAAQTQSLGASIATGDAGIPTAGQVRQLARDAAASVQGKARRAVVVAPDWVAGAILEALSRQGFTARAQDGSERDALAQARADGTPWVIVARATTTPGGKIFSLVAATAALDVRALDARSGAVVASTQKTSKSTGRTPDAAQKNAASEAGVGAGSEVAAALLAKEAGGL